MSASKAVIYVATGNAHKVAELQVILGQLAPGYALLPATAIGGMPEVDENAPDFAGNARLKAEALRTIAPADSLVLADDSGLEVSALNGAPGVHTARYAGIGATDVQNRGKLLQALEGNTDRHARFVCVLCLGLGDGTFYAFEGVCYGQILRAETGSAGFGYDPVFQPAGDCRSFAQMSGEEKNRYSHRAHAAEALAEFLASR